MSLTVNILYTYTHTYIYNIHNIYIYNILNLYIIYIYITYILYISYHTYVFILYYWYIIMVNLWLINKGSGFNIAWDQNANRRDKNDYLFYNTIFSYYLNFITYIFFYLACSGWIWEMSTEVYSEPCQASNMELSAKLVHGWRQLRILSAVCLVDGPSFNRYSQTELLLQTIWG